LKRSKTLLLICSGFFCGILAGFAFRPSTKTLETIATEAWNRGNAPESEHLARRILARNDQSDRAYEILNQVASHDGKPLMKVAILLTRADDSNQAYGRCIQAGDLALRYHYAAVAEDSWNRALQLDSQRELASQRLISLAALRLDSEKLIELLFDHLHQFGFDVESLRLLLNCETLDREAEELQEILQKYLDADPDDPISRQGLARCYISLGHPEAAAELWVAPPARLNSRVVYARALIESGEQQLAIPLLKSNQEELSSAELLFVRGLLALELKKYKVAKTNFHQAVILRPLNHEMRSYYTDALRLAGDVQENEKQSELLKVSHHIFRLTNDPNTQFDKKLIETLRSHCKSLGADRYVQVLNPEP
jgi:tetratricopeptide (TPR) repeat protein